MLDPSQRKQREYYSGPPCPHYPHKFKTEAAHQAKVASRLRAHRRFQKHSLDYRLKAMLRTIVQRCESKTHIGYKYYGGKGIKNFLTLNQIYFLWKRDKAWRLKRPSIDRLHSTDHYELSKVRFIELRENIQLGNRARRTRLIATAKGMET